MQTLLCTAEPRHQTLCQTGLGPGCRSWREFDTGSFSIFHTGEGAEGRDDPLSVLQCLPQSSGDTGNGGAASSLCGSCAPCSHTGSSLFSEVPTDDPCVKGHVHLSSLHPSVSARAQQGCTRLTLGVKKVAVHS